ncbi:sodium:calcium antiporter [Legionella sp. D16C41]|uniref:sodium:calcium antiporter n=1 Tax=Legionella sp. D16C41 TaxID=3402688 RepID=UPI003AF679FE
MLPLLLLLVSAIAIYFSCEYFVNGIEWFGRRFNVTKNATGTILAAFGTALPESIVTFVAVVLGSNSTTKEIGIGTAIGGPLVLATIAYSVVGLTFVLVKKYHNKLLNSVGERRLSHDQLWFMIIFIVKIVLGMLVFSWKPWLGLAFFIAYGLYVRQEMTGEDDPEHLDFLEALKIKPNETNPATYWIILQTVLALVVVFISSQIFVYQLETIGPWLGLSSQLVALLLSPIATELPEIMNAFIWVRQGKHLLALANISGAMMIQATIPSGLGLLFTPWLLNGESLWGAFLTLLAILIIYLMLKRGGLTASRLASIGLFYILFLIGLFFITPFAS